MIVKIVQLLIVMVKPERMKDTPNGVVNHAYSNTLQHCVIFPQVTFFKSESLSAGSFVLLIDSVGMGKDSSTLRCLNFFKGS